MEGRSMLHTALLYATGLTIIVPVGLALSKLVGQPVEPYIVPSLVLLLIIAQHLYSARAPRQQDAAGREHEAGDVSGAGILKSVGKADKESPSPPAAEAPAELPLAARYRAEDPGRLARLLLLDIFGPTLLTRPAAIAMKAAAFMLTINFIFNVFVWALVWNTILFNGRLAVGLKTMLAVLIGVLFASLLLLYERRALTADSSLPRRRRIFASLLRLIIVSLTALVTAQPVALLVLSGPIRSRIHEESVISEANKRLQELRIKSQAVGDARPLSSADQERLAKWIAEIRAAEPGAVVSEGSGWIFEDQQYDMFQHYRVLADLSEGNPPRWHNINEADRAFLATRYNLDKAVSAESPALFRYAYWISIWLVLLMPLLTSVLRLSVPEDIKEYYSSVRQAQARAFQGWGSGSGSVEQFSG
jgi:hypothetical protein